MGPERVSWHTAHASCCRGQCASTFSLARLPSLSSSCEGGRLALQQPTQRALKAQEVRYKPPLLLQDPPSETLHPFHSGAPLSRSSPDS